MAEIKNFDSPVTVNPKPGLSGVLTRRKHCSLKTKGLPKKKNKLITETSSDDSNYSIQGSDKEFRLSTISVEDLEFGSPQSPLISNSFSPGDFLVTNVYRKKRNTHIFTHILLEFSTKISVKCGNFLK